MDIVVLLNEEFFYEELTEEILSKITGISRRDNFDYPFYIEENSRKGIIRVLYSTISEEENDNVIFLNENFNIGNDFNFDMIDNALKEYDLLYYDNFKFVAISGNAKLDFYKCLLEQDEVDVNYDFVINNLKQFSIDEIIFNREV